jgi:hypothetical protein
METPGPGFSYSVAKTHHYFMFKRGGDCFCNQAIVPVKNEGLTPLWCSVSGFKCSVYTEGLSVVYTDPILPGQTRNYSVVLNPSEDRLVRARRALLKQDCLGTFEFDILVHEKVPNGLTDRGMTATTIYCAYLVPQGHFKTYKIIHNIT